MPNLNNNKHSKKPTNHRPRNDALPAARYMLDLNEGVFFLMYADMCLRRALARAPDPALRALMEPLSANVARIHRQGKETRNRSLKRYTPRGERKPATTQPPGKRARATR
jgi:hypothetical protein